MSEQDRLALCELIVAVRQRIASIESGLAWACEIARTAEIFNAPSSSAWNPSVVNRLPRDPWWSWQGLLRRQESAHSSQTAGTAATQNEDGKE